jgi:asparagine synthase (glutamine-hydrolysing)
MDMAFGVVGLKAESVRWNERIKAKLPAREAAALEWLSPSIGALLGVVPEDMTQVHRVEGLTVVFSGQLFNHDELAGRYASDELDITTSALMARLYRVQGMSFTEALRGRYWLLLWDNTAHAFTFNYSPFLPQGFFYSLEQGVLRFSTYFPVFRVLADKKLEINPRKLAMFIMDNPYEPETGFHQGVKRLLSGQQLIVERGEARLVKIWTPDKIVTPISYKTREEYIDAFREIFVRAVGRCIPKDGAVASELSGGLDSSSVSAVAADLMRSNGRRLQSFGGVPPLGFTFPTHPNANLDDRDLMKAVADHSGNIDLHLVDTSVQVLPLNHLAKFAHDYCEGPIRNTGNINWMFNMYQQASALGAKTVLNGHMGNATISWTGGLDQRLYYRLRRLVGKAKRQCRDYLFPAKQAVFGYSAIHPEAIKRYGLKAAEQLDREDVASSHKKFIVLCINMMALGMDLSVALQLNADIRMADPSVDLEVLNVCLQVPTMVYRDNGRSRLLIRDAMNLYLPKNVRSNTRFGLQNADWFEPLKLLAPYYLDHCSQWKQNPLLAEMIDLPSLERLLNTLRYSSPEQSDFHLLSKEYQLKLNRALHIMQWVLMSSDN